MFPAHLRCRQVEAHSSGYWKKKGSLFHRWSGFHLQMHTTSNPMSETPCQFVSLHQPIPVQHQRYRTILEENMAFNQRQTNLQNKHSGCVWHCCGSFLPSCWCTTVPRIGSDSVEQHFGITKQSIQRYMRTTKFIPTMWKQVLTLVRATNAKNCVLIWGCKRLLQKPLWRLE